MDREKQIDITERLRHEQSMNPNRDEYQHEVLGRAASEIERLRSELSTARAERDAARAEAERLRVVVEKLGHALNDVMAFIPHESRDLGFFEEGIRALALVPDLPITLSFADRVEAALSAVEGGT